MLSISNVHYKDALSSTYLGGEATNFEDDFADTEAIVDFLANPESMELPDKIEEVNGNQLEKLIKEKTFVAVFFCKYTYNNPCYFYKEFNEISYASSFTW